MTVYDATPPVEARAWLALLVAVPSLLAAPVLSIAVYLGTVSGNVLSGGHPTALTVIAWPAMALLGVPAFVLGRRADRLVSEAARAGEKRAHAAIVMGILASLGAFMLYGFLLIVL